LVLGEIATNFLETAITLFKDEKEPVGWQLGQWCIVDLKRKKHDSKKLIREEAWSDVQMFGDYDTGLQKTLEREDYSIGFFVEHGPHPTLSIMAFVFETQRVINVKMDDVRPMNDTMAAAYDKSKEYSLIREIFVLQETDPTHVDSKIPCDPGTEVVLKGETYHVVACSGLNTVIEDVDGRRQQVSMKDIHRGRTTRAGAFNYTPSGEHLTPGYDHRSLMTGSWIWIPASQSHQRTYPDATVCLCVLGYFHGERVVCYQAFNGIEVVIAEWQIQPVSDEVVDFLGKIKSFQSFRQSASESNVNVTTKSVGRQFIDTCFGNMEGFAIRYLEREPPEILKEVTGESRVLPTAGLVVLAKRTTSMDVDDEEDPGSRPPAKNTVFIAAGVAAVVACVYFLQS
jgi:hypothetical protein